MNKHFITVFLISGVIIGVLLTWQFSASVPLSTDFPSDEIEAKEDLLKEYLDEQSYLQSRIVSLREQINESQISIETQSEVFNIDFLNKLKKNVGLTEVSGSGIEILLDDSPFAFREGADVTDSHLVQASDIRDIVNLLNSANVYAISVNNQRIIATSPISSVGTTILVNNAYIAPPFTITAVGDTESILQRLLDPVLLPDLYERAKKSNIVFEIAKKNITTVSIYNGDLKTNYINLVE